MIKTSKIALLSLVTVLTACQNNDAPKALQETDGRQIISLTVADAKSRAGRELQSSEPGQTIENVKIILVDETNTVVWTKLCSDWMNTDAVEIANGREASIEVPKDEFRMLSGQIYHVYGIGYSENSDYDLSYYQGIKVDDTFVADSKIKLNHGGPVAEEIFAGDAAVEGAVDGVRVSLVLNRQVAGTFGYLTKIPYVYDAAGHVGQYLMLTASNPQCELALGKFDNNSSASAYVGNFVVNGTNACDKNVIYTIDLKDWFAQLTPQRDETGRSLGLIKVEDNWKGEKSKYRKGSVFAGEFIVPFAKTEASSMQLLLCYDNDVNTAMRVWNVTLPEDALQVSSYDVWTMGTDGWSSTKVTDDIRVYNVLRNHLYGIGTRDSSVLPGWNPDDPDAPVADDPSDEPEPINNKQELTITVNHNWGVILNMGVE